MPSHSPSRRTPPLSHHSRESSHRSPSFGMRGTSRRGRSPPSDARRRKILPRSGGTRTGEGGLRGQRNSEFRNAPRSIPPGSYQQGQYSTLPTHQTSHSPRTTASKRRSFSPSMPVIPSTSGLKRKRIPHPRSSSTSSSSLNSPPRSQHRHQVIKLKKPSVERAAASREPPVSRIGMRVRPKSPVRERSHVSRTTSRFSIGAAESSLDVETVTKGSSYSVGGRPPAAKATSRFALSPRQHENPQKRFMAEPVVRYGGGGNEGRPVYRGPEGKGPASFSERELKKITVGILRSIPADEPQINRQIVNPEDVVVVRRPDGFAGAEGIRGEMFRLVNVRTDKGEIVQALSKVLPNKVDLEVGGMARGSFNECLSEGSRPIFEREELHLTHISDDDVEEKYEGRERRMRQLYHSSREERPRVEAQQQPIEQRVVAIVDDEPVLPSHRSLRGQVRRSRSPLATISRSGGSRLESISPTPMVLERQRASYYNSSLSPPPHSRVSGNFGAVATSRHTRDYEQAGPSHAHPGTSSQARHKDGSRRNEDLRYELEIRRRDDASYDRRSHEFRDDSDGDLRVRINEKRTTDHHRISHYHDDDDNDAVGVHTKVVSERRYAMEHHMEGPHDPRRRAMERGGGHRMTGQREDAEHEEFQPRGSFINKPSTSAAPSWDGNPEYVPKGRAYYEHDNRDEWVRLGGAQRGGRGQYAGTGGNRGRFFRGGFVQRGRGRGRGRGSYMGHINRGYMRGGGSGGMRRSTAHVSGVGGGNSSRGKPSSPSLWKHDMFENLSSDENRPTSTTSDTKR